MWLPVITVHLTWCFSIKAPLLTSAMSVLESNARSAGDDEWGCIQSTHYARATDLSSRLMLRALAVRAQRPVSGAALAVYRVLWSLVLAYECLTYLARPKKLARLSTTSFHFPFWGFEWIPILSVECTQTRLADLTSDATQGCAFSCRYSWCPRSA